MGDTEAGNPGTNDNLEKDQAATRRNVVLSIIAILAIPAIWFLLTKEPPPPPGPHVNTAEAQGLLDSSARYAQNGQFAESLASAQAALQADPESADAYNNIAIASMKLGKWDEAVAAAKKAVEMNPGSQLARNNLAWVEAARKQAGQ